MREKDSRRRRQNTQRGYRAGCRGGNTAGVLPPPKTAGAGLISAQGSFSTAQKKFDAYAKFYSTAKKWQIIKRSRVAAPLLLFINLISRELIQRRKSGKESKLLNGRINIMFRKFISIFSIYRSMSWINAARISRTG